MFLFLYEQVFISYIDQLAPSGERKRQLREQYYFECSCSSCEDEALVSMRQVEISRKVIATGS